MRSRTSLPLIAMVLLAAFWLVAGSIHPDADLTLRGVGVNPTRRAVIDILGPMGARIDEQPVTEGDREPIADITVRSSSLRRRSVSTICLTERSRARRDWSCRRRTSFW